MWRPACLPATGARAEHAQARLCLHCSNASQHLRSLHCSFPCAHPLHFLHALHHPSHCRRRPPPHPPFKLLTHSQKERAEFVTSNTYYPRESGGKCRVLGGQEQKQSIAGAVHSGLLRQLRPLPIRALLPQRDAAVGVRHRQDVAAHAPADPPHGRTKVVEQPPLPAACEARRGAR